MGKRGDLDALPSAGDHNSLVEEYILPVHPQTREYHRKIQHQLRRVSCIVISTPIVSYSCLLTSAPCKLNDLSRGFSDPCQNSIGKRQIHFHYWCVISFRQSTGKKSRWSSFVWKEEFQTFHWAHVLLKERFKVLMHWYHMYSTYTPSMSSNCGFSGRYSWKKPAGGSEGIRLPMNLTEILPLMCVSPYRQCRQDTLIPLDSPKAAGLFSRARKCHPGWYNCKGSR